MFLFILNKDTWSDWCNIIKAHSISKHQPQYFKETVLFFVVEKVSKINVQNKEMVLKESCAKLTVLPHNIFLEDEKAFSANFTKMPPFLCLSCYP